MAERMWEDQHSGALVLNCMSSCKTFLIVGCDLIKERLVIRRLVIIQKP